jgi:hypothetical protein
LSIEFSDFTFGEVYDQDFLIIHNVIKIERRLRLTDNISNQPIGIKRYELRRKIWDNFSFFSISH